MQKLVKNGRMACTCNPSLQEAEEEDLQFWINQNYVVKPSLKKRKRKKERGGVKQGDE